MFRNAFGALVALVCLAVPASAATTFNFGGSNGSFNSLSYSQDGINLTVTPGYFSLLGAEEGSGKVTRDATGLGVKAVLDLDGDVDGQGINDLLVFSFDQIVNITSIVFTDADSDDEFTLFGDDLAFLGQHSLAGANPFTFSFSGDFLASKIGVGAWDNGDSFRVASLTVSAIPEPATWLMMIMGFGLVGLAARRRSVVAAA